MARTEPSLLRVQESYTLSAINHLRMRTGPRVRGTCSGQPVPRANGQNPERDASNQPGWEGSRLIFCHRAFSVPEEARMGLVGGGYCLPRLCVIGLSSSFLCASIFVEGLCSLRELCGQGDGAEAARQREGGGSPCLCSERWSGRGEGERIYREKRKA